jgi:hypothetical protein
VKRRDDLGDATWSRPGTCFVWVNEAMEACLLSEALLSVGDDLLVEVRVRRHR